MCSGCGGCACSAILTVVWWLNLEKTPRAIDGGFLTEFGLNTRRWWFWRELVATRGVKTKQLRMERVVVGSKTQELVHFAPDGVDRLYVYRGSLV
jgi:hypothetical protein